MHHKHKRLVYEFVAQFVFYYIQNLTGRRQAAAVYPTYLLSLNIVFEGVSQVLSLNLLLLLDSNITAALLFVAAAAEHVYGP